MPVQRKPTRKQELILAISTRGAHLSLSKNTINGLARHAVNADEQRTEELLNLISQPDPHRSLQHALPPRIRDVHADYCDDTEEDFAQWVANANIAYHQVDEYLNRHSAYHHNNPENDRLTARFMQGMQHYRDANKGYSERQLIDLAMIAAASHCAYFKDSSGEAIANDIFNDDTCSHSWCARVSNPLIIELAASSHETALNIIRIITEEGFITQSHILYRLENGPLTLADGVI